MDPDFAHEHVVAFQVLRQIGQDTGGLEQNNGERQVKPGALFGQVGRD